MGTNTRVALGTVTVSGTSTSTVTFSAINQGYTDLVLESSNVTTTSGGGFVALRFNNDTASNYGNTYLTGNGSTATSGRATGSVIYIIGDTDTTNATMGTAHINNYSNATTFKPVVSRCGYAASTTQLITSSWIGTPAAITTITLTCNANFGSGSTFSLYGIAPAATTSPLATGGLIYQDDDYYWHTFASSGTFTPTAALTDVDYLVVAGGGGSGGSSICGGGGAGGYKTTVGTSGGNTSALSKISLNSGTAYTITVGAGGSSTSNGSSSSISGTGLTTISTDGGGYGNTGGGANGGSGAGGGATNNDPTYPAGSGQTGQGFAGGTGLTDRYSGAVWRVAGGGGGAGGTTVTKNSSTIEPSVFANGGPGLVSAIDGVARGGGGGGGLQYGDKTQTVGGFGGGGTGGGYVIRPVNGTPNTGGGGGGVGYGGIADNYPSSGGSGVVIIRYPKA